MDRPFWETTYADENVSTFSKGPTEDVRTFFEGVRTPLRILDAGCGEGRNALYLAEKGHQVEGFDLSEAGIAKARKLAAARSLSARFTVEDLAHYVFAHPFDAVLCHGVLHLPEREARNRFVDLAKAHTVPGGVHVTGIFTNRRPATPDNAPFTRSLFDVGELPRMYADWTLLSHDEGIFHDTHPGGIRHEHAYERLIARKP